MQTEIGKWGNSLAIRIPKAMADELKLSEGSAAQLGIDSGNLVLRPCEKKRTLDDLLATVKEAGGYGETTEWGADVGNEQIEW